MSLQIRNAAGDVPSESLWVLSVGVEEASAGGGHHLDEHGLKLPDGHCEARIQQ